MTSTVQAHFPARSLSHAKVGVLRMFIGKLMAARDVAARRQVARYIDETSKPGAADEASRQALYANMRGM